MLLYLSFLKSIDDVHHKRYPEQRRFAYSVALAEPNVSPLSIILAGLARQDGGVTRPGVNARYFETI